MAISLLSIYCIVLLAKCLNKRTSFYKFGQDKDKIQNINKIHKNISHITYYYITNTTTLKANS